METEGDFTSELSFFDGRRMVKVFVIHEGLPAALRAKADCETTLRRDARTARLEFAWWRMDMLRRGVLRDRATDMACCADLVVITAPNADALPSDLDGWIGGWLRRRLRRDRPRAMVILPNEYRPLASQTTPALNRLRRAAKEGWLDLFHQRWEPPLDELFKRSHRGEPDRGSLPILLSRSMDL